jgi:hypothetical protein
MRRFLIPLLPDRCDDENASRTVNYGSREFQHFMIGTTLGHGSNLAHGESRAKARTDPQRRGFRHVALPPCRRVAVLP